MPSWEEGEYYDVCFAIEKSRRYHAKMRAYYDWCHHLARAATALTGTASFFVVLARDLGIAKFLTGIVAVAASIDSVFRFERKARIHDALYRRFTALAAKITDWQPIPQNLNKARAARLQIEADEPPVRRLVDLQAQNEECRARGVSADDLIPLTSRQRWLGYIFEFDMERLEAWEAERRSRQSEVGVNQAAAQQPASDAGRQ